MSGFSPIAKQNFPLQSFNISSGFAGFLRCEVEPEPEVQSVRNEVVLKRLGRRQVPPQMKCQGPKFSTLWSDSGCAAWPSASADALTDALVCFSAVVRVVLPTSVSKASASGSPSELGKECAHQSPNMWIKPVSILFSANQSDIVHTCRNHTTHLHQDEPAPWGEL